MGFKAPRDSRSLSPTKRGVAPLKPIQGGSLGKDVRMFKTALFVAMAAWVPAGVLAIQANTPATQVVVTPATLDRGLGMPEPEDFSVREPILLSEQVISVNIPAGPAKAGWVCGEWRDLLQGSGKVRPCE